MLAWGSWRQVEAELDRIDRFLTTVTGMHRECDRIAEDKRRKALNEFRGAPVVYASPSEETR